MKEHHRKPLNPKSYSILACPSKVMKQTLNESATGLLKKNTKWAGQHLIGVSSHLIEYISLYKTV